MSIIGVKMPEATKDAMLLITTSYQALKRTHTQEPAIVSTTAVDCISIIVFMGFYIEASLNYAIDTMGKRENLKEFVGEDDNNIGLGKSIAWSYNEFIAKPEIKVQTIQDFTDAMHKEKNDYFDGIKGIKEFRNNIAHG